MNTPDDFVPDHIDGNPCDNRPVNLRNCTRKENSYNRRTAKDNPDYGEYSYAKSQGMANENETYHFHDAFVYTGVLGEIWGLPEKNIFKTKLRDVGRMKLDGTLSEENEDSFLLQLIKDYLMDKKDAASA